MLRLFNVTVAVVALAAGASPVEGQSRLRLGLSGGATIPVGRFGDLNDAGFNFGGHLLLTSPFLPQTLKLDAQHNRLKFAGTDTNTLITSVTLNLELTPTRAHARVAPYVSAGLGGYYVKTVFRDAPTTTRYDDVTKFGLNAGAGVRLAVTGINAFLEAKYHAVRSHSGDFLAEVRYVPIVLGITL